MLKLCTDDPFYLISDNRIEDMYSLYSKQSEKKSSDVSKEGEVKNGEPEESEEELTEDVKDLLNELLSDVLGEFDGNIVDNTGGLGIFSSNSIIRVHQQKSV